MPCPGRRCKFKFPAPLLLLSPSLSEPQAESCSVLCQYFVTVLGSLSRSAAAALLCLSQPDSEAGLSLSAVDTRQIRRPVTAVDRDSSRA